MKETLKDGSIVEKHHYGYELNQCPDVEHYTVPDMVVEVSPSAFENAKRLLRIDFNNVKDLYARKEYIYKDVPYFEGTGWAGYEKEMTGKIYHGIFENCPLVCQIEMPHIESIHEFALSNLKQLQSLTLPADLTYCSNFAFYGSAIQSIRAYGKVFNGILHYNGEDIIFANSDGKEIDVNLNDFTDNLRNLHQIFLYDTDTVDIKKTMYTVSKLPNIIEITFSTPFIASMMRKIYSDYPFADHIKDAGVKGDSINRITVVCFCEKKPYERTKNYGVEINLSDKHYVILEELVKEHPEIREDIHIIQQYDMDLHNTIWNYITENKRENEPIERCKLRF